MRRGFIALCALLGGCVQYPYLPDGRNPYAEGPPRLYRAPEPAAPVVPATYYAPEPEPVQGEPEPGPFPPATSSDQLQKYYECVRINQGYIGNTSAENLRFLGPLPDCGAFLR